MDILKKYNRDAANENDSRVELFKSLDTDKIVYKDKYGILTTLNNETSGNSGAVVTTTLEVVDLIRDNALTPGQSYFITDADSTLYGGTSVLVQAISTNELGLSGEGLFYTPKYDPINYGSYGIWDAIPYKFYINSFSNDPAITFTGIVTQDSTTGSGTGFSATVNIVDGNFNGEPVISTYGQGYLFGDIITVLGSQVGGIDGIDDITFSIFSSVDYQIGGIAFWGGKAWTNLTGLIGNSIGKYALDSNWEVIPFNATDYNVSIDAIHYDYANDRIVKREDKLGNEVSSNTYMISAIESEEGHPIRDFQWGNPSNYGGPGYEGGCTSNRVLDSLFECINFRCSRMSLNTITNGSFVYNNTFTNSFYKNNIDGSSVTNNEVGSFWANNLFNGCYLAYNIFTSIYSGIQENDLFSNAVIYNNIGGDGSIRNNKLTSSSISDNYGSYIDITNNILQYNSNISYNDISGSYIQNNIMNSSTITNTPAYASIRNNEFFNSTLDSIIYTMQLEKLTIKDSYIGPVDLSTAVDIYGEYTKNIFTNSASVVRLSYVNAADALIVTDITN